MSGWLYHWVVTVLIVSDGKKYNFSFREDTHCWYLLINEMWSGRIMSEEKSDPLVRDLAVQNALFVDAFLRRLEIFHSICLLTYLGRVVPFMHNVSSP